MYMKILAVFFQRRYTRYAGNRWFNEEVLCVVVSCVGQMSKIRLVARNLENSFKAGRGSDLSPEP